MRVLACPDRFRGTATAGEVATAVARACAAVPGVVCVAAPVADGGEGTLEALGGARRRTTVRGPLGDPVEAEWRVNRRHVAVIEMARASGLSLVGGPAGNDPLRATSHGTGELIAAAVDEGARRVIVGLGGSATTDGGLAALTALNPTRRMHGVDVVVACDVPTTFLDAARVFAPQKGATPAQVALLERRLDRLAQVYLRDYGVDVRDLAGSGAAGGLGGGLAAAGAHLVAGFDVVADALSLPDRMADADLVVTGEGLLDATTFGDEEIWGKAVGGVLRLASEVGVPVLVVAGDVVADELPPLPAGVAVVSLVSRFGVGRAVGDVLGCVEAVVGSFILR